MQSLSQLLTDGWCKYLNNNWAILLVVVKTVTFSLFRYYYCGVFIFRVNRVDFCMKGTMFQICSLRTTGRNPMGLLII